jgi:hypothetical protein
MKRILIASLAILLISSAIESYALTAAVQAVCGANSSGCSSPDSNTESSGNLSLGKDDANDMLYVSGSFTSGSAYTLKSFTVNLLRTSTDPSLTITGKICTDNEGDPSTTCTTADATVASSALSTSAAPIRFKIAAGYSIENATRYHIVISVNALGTATKYIYTTYLNTGSEAQRGSPDGTTWTAVDTSSTSVYSTSTCENE